MNIFFIKIMIFNKNKKEIGENKKIFIIIHILIIIH